MPQELNEPVKTGGKPLTIGRLVQVERGEGEPPSEGELEEIRRFKASKVAKRLVKIAREAQPGMRVYRAATPAQRRRMRNMRCGEVAALARAGKLPRRAPAGVSRETGARESRTPASRRRRVRAASRDGPGSRSSEDDDPHDLAAIRRPPAVTEAVAAEVLPRVIAAIEGLEEGDYGFVVAVLRDLEEDLRSWRAAA
jgi:hypothetical protein